MKNAKCLLIDYLSISWSNIGIKINKNIMKTKVSTFSGVISVAIIAAVVGAFIYSEIEEYDSLSVDAVKYEPVKKNKEENFEKEKECPICETKTELEINLPAIRFIPGTFSDKEKEDLMEKVINPFIDFEKDSYVENRIISIAINKYSDSELVKMQDPKYMYNISVIYEEGYGGWLERKVGEPIDYWVPDCMDECEFSEEFQKKYPKVVEKYNNIQNP